MRPSDYPALRRSALAALALFDRADQVALRCAPRGVVDGFEAEIRFGERVATAFLPSSIEFDHDIDESVLAVIERATRRIRPPTPELARA